MEKTIIKTTLRDGQGSSSANKLRNEGKVPATIYGPEMASKNIVINQNEITKFVTHHGSGAKVFLEIDGKEEMAIIKNLQRSTVKKEIMHIEFLHLNAGEKIKIALPVVFTGEEKINSKYIVQKLVHELTIESLPKDLVDNIEISIGHLNVGDSMTLSEADFSSYKGIEFIDDADTMLVTVSEPQSASVEGEEGADADTAPAVASEEDAE